MESTRFDLLTRLFGTLRTRRTLMALLGGIVASSDIEVEETAAKRRNRTTPRNSNKHEKNRKRQDAQAEGKGKRKGKGKGKGKGCKSPQAKCGGDCVTIQSDALHCGACGNACAAGQTCSAGQCTGGAAPDGGGGGGVPVPECPPETCCADNQVCAGDGRCRFGQCHPKPSCRSNGETYRQGDAPDCCSENASFNVGTTHIEITCLPGALGNPCLGDGDCRSGSCIGYECVGACSIENPCAQGQCCAGAYGCGPCLVFLTSTVFHGAFGGLSGADAICQQHARAAGLPGVYLAWLSDAGRGPVSRFIRATVPYIMPGGGVVAESWADLTSGRALDHAINHTESGTDLSGVFHSSWTNTTPGGLPDGTDNSSHCSNWTVLGGSASGRIGDARSTTDWTQEASHPHTKCTNEAHLYCFQQR